MRTKPVALTREQGMEWAAKMQYQFLNALMEEHSVLSKGLAFQGGTSLHFSWRSPRLSEDLDFLISSRVEEELMARAVTNALQKTREAFLTEDPNFQIEIKDKSRDPDRMLVFHLTAANPQYVGKSMVKVEFWKVTPEYLAKYPTELRSPMKNGDMVSTVSNAAPAAALETAYCDKLTAFATRPYLKMRDVFDLWWIGTQTDADLAMPKVTAQFLHNVTAYETINDLAPAAALRKFLEQDPEAMFIKAEEELKQWLPEQVWQRYYPEGVRQMIDYTREALSAVADAIERPESVSAVNLKRAKPR